MTDFSGDEEKKNILSRRKTLKIGVHAFFKHNNSTETSVAKEVHHVKTLDGCGKGGGGGRWATVVDGWWPSRPWQSGRRLKTHKQDQLRYPILDVLKRKKPPGSSRS